MSNHWICLKYRPWCGVGRCGMSKMWTPGSWTKCYEIDSVGVLSHV